MKQQFLNHLNALLIAEQMLHSEVKDRQIEGFFTWISTLNKDDLFTDYQTHNNIRYRYVSYSVGELCFSVTVIQTNEDDMIMIDKNFE